MIISREYRASEQENETTISLQGLFMGHIVIGLMEKRMETTISL